MGLRKSGRGAPALIGTLSWLGALALFGPPAAGQERPALTPDDYGRWERLGAFALDPTGRWLVTSVERVDERVELRLHRSDGTGEALVLEHATGPVFSADGRWMAYRKGRAPDGAASERDEEGEEGEEGGESPPDRLGLVDLVSASDTVLFEVESFAFRDDGAWLAARGVPAADTVGGDLLVLDPSSGERTLIGNVDAFEWQDEGGLLAATLRTAAGVANGVVVFDPAAGTLRTLASGDARFRALSWREDSAQLAVLRSVASEDHEEETHDVLVWRDVGTGTNPQVLAARPHDVLADTLRVTASGGIAFSDDGRTVFVGLRPWTRSEPEAGEGEDTGTGRAEEEGRRADEAKPADDEAEDEDEAVGPADVQVWHSNDDLILRAQEYSARQLAERTLAAAWHLSDERLVVLGTELDEEVRVVAGGRWGVVPDYDPYHVARRFGDETADWYRVDVATGARTLLAQAAPLGLDAPVDVDRALLYQDDQWSVIELPTLRRMALGSGRSFTRSLFDYDYPGPRPDWGIGGWLEGGEVVLLYDKHDVWRADLGDGRVVRLTRGAEEGRRYRVVQPDPDAPSFGTRALDPDEPLWLSVFDLRSKASGYARVRPGGEAETLVLEDARVAGLVRARDTERYALRVERWDDAPDVFVVGGDVGDLVQVTRINPFQADFAWGRAELLDYTTAAGHDLQAILVHPAGFEVGRRYPLILYQYERLSDGVHNYDVPSERDYYNYQAWSQQGYFVLMPDIVYEPGRPGPSALDAVERALDAAVATGHVDPARMGVIGHSWGGYQASYLPTRTDRFAAAVAGAPITNFLSFMGAVHWNGGLPETGHWETGQARMAVPYWEDLEGHLESSPAHGIANLDTPMLLMHGDADGVVDFRQGLEFYNYARRAGKQVVLLVYPGADHGLREEEHQVDYHRRILEWFGHYLKGEPAAKWITDGETWLEREKRIGK
jgi:dipeptidyl aminopeptidase/acylaminoacyl peptidase